MSGGAQVVMLVPGSGCKYGWSFAHSLLLIFYCGAQLGAPAIDNNCKLWTKYNQLPEGSGKWTKVGRFWRGMETLKEAPVLSEFPISNALGSRQATITSWWRATELTKTCSLLAEEPEDTVWVSHSHSKVREEIPKRGVSEKESFKLYVQTLPKPLDDCWPHTQGTDSEALKAKAKRTQLRPCPPQVRQSLQLDSNQVNC